MFASFEQEWGRALSGEVYMIAVDPAFQRRGIAARPTDRALDEMRGRGIARVVS